MSLQFKITKFMLYYLIRPAMTKELNLRMVRLGEMKEPEIKQDFGCSYDADLLEDVAITWVRPPAVRTENVIVYLHGGLYVAGITSRHWEYLSRMCAETGSTGLMVDYRLAPENVYPAAVADVVRVLTTLTESHGAENLILMGDSAGGGLSVACTLKLRDTGRPLPAKLVLLSPWLDVTMQNPSIRPLEKKDRLMALPGTIEAGLLYAGDTDPTTPYISPVYADLTGLPPILLQIGAHEILMPDCRVFRDKALAEGVDLTYQEYPNMFHIWMLLFSVMPDAEEAVEAAKGFIQQD